MKKNSFHLYLIVLSWTLITANMCNAEVPNKALLPDDFKVYYKQDDRLSRNAFKGSNQKIIPVNSDYNSSPGCYLACYAKHHTHSVYKIDGNYMMGQIRVPGRYANGLCVPKGYENKNVKTAAEFKEKCEKVFPQKCEKASCWADSKTSNYWFY